MTDEDAPEIDDFTLTAPWGEEDVAALPSFKPLPEHRRANARQADCPHVKPARHAHIPLPRLDMRALPMPETAPPPRVRRLPGRIMRGFALLLAGAGIGAASLYLTSDGNGRPATDDRPMTETKFYTMLPPAVPAVAPPEILYVDKWRIVAIDPLSLADAVKAEEPAMRAPPEAQPKAMGMFAPAVPLAPPPKVILLERFAKALPELKRPARETKQASLSATKPTPSQPAAPAGQTDVLQEMKQWLSSSPRQR